MALPLRDDSELDELTLRRAQRGDGGGGRGPGEGGQRPVFALISRMIGHGPAVEDLAQDTFLKAFRALGRFDPAGAARLSTWLLTIAARLAVDHARRREPAPMLMRAAPASAELRSAL